MDVLRNVEWSLIAALVLASLEKASLMPEPQSFVRNPISF
jgi:hypothetical protein